MERVPYLKSADLVLALLRTSCVTCKQRGVSSGLILCGEELVKRSSKTCVPGPLEQYERRVPGKVRAEPEQRPSELRNPARRHVPPETPSLLPAAATASRAAHDMSQTRWTGKRTDMLPEIAAAVGFLSSLLRTRGCVSEQRLKVFSGALQEALTEHYKHHWFPEKPSKGSGYRCIRINHKMDPIISKVASQIGLSQPQLRQLLPSELTLWVDPYEVSYRIGEDGSICVLYEEAPVAASYGLLTCKNQMMLGRSSPSKNYVMAVSS